MKIVHIAPNAPYNDYWGYQDNLLPKYQKKLGHDVTIIVPNLMHKDGKIIETACGEYVLNDGVRVIRRKYRKYLFRILSIWNSRLQDVFRLLKEIKPDFIFYHGLVSSTIFDAIKYKKKMNTNCVIVQDNHLDYNIGIRIDRIRDKIHRSFYRAINRRSIKWVAKVYGVTPWRAAYAQDYFGIPKMKTDVLIMGADDEQIDFSHKFQVRGEIRKKYSIGNDDFLVVTGGKIDAKKNIHLLMQALRNLKGIKLLIFGEVEDDVKSAFQKEYIAADNIIFIGWLKSSEVYNYFFAADLVCFPGQHSVLWEQACASKVPCAFKKYDGMQHVDNGGNSAFFPDITVESLRTAIIELKFTERYYAMKKVAESEATDIYLYSNIAKKSLESVSMYNNFR